MQSVHEIAMGKWDFILMEFGINTDIRKNAPCPICGGNDRFRYVGQEYGKWVCTHCTEGRYKGGMDLALLMDGKPFADVARRVEELAGHARPVEVKKTDPAIRLREMWRGCHEANRVVKDYLAGRGLETPDALMSGRFPYWDDGPQPVNCMVAKVEDQKGPISLHVTYFRDAGKARKMMPPTRPASAAFVRLYPLAPTLGISEGIETGIAAAMLHRLPVWPCLNAGSLERFTPPEGVRRIVIFGDTDESYTGQAAAYSAAKRLRLAGYSVDVRLPESGDWADQIRKNNG